MRVLTAILCSLVVASCARTTSSSPLPAQATGSQSRSVLPAYTLLYSFQGKHGVHPEGGLTYVKGTFYGETLGGGANHLGTIFGATSAGERVIYSFDGGTDGARPFTKLDDVNGTLYGVTVFGGATGCSSMGCGTIFKTTTSGKETVLYRFKDPSEGAFPGAGLIAMKGWLYGTTQAGGSSSEGTVFKITTSATLKVTLHNFAGAPGDGAGPSAPLTNVSGTLYGTTYNGGADNVGTVFAITPSGTEAVLHSFAGADGANPSGGLTNVNGTLYGTTYQGGAENKGTVFTITPSGTETVLYSFTGAPSDGASPWDELVFIKNALYGVTVDGGANDEGTVFKITTLGQVTLVHSFMGRPSDGKSPSGPLAYIGHMLYGTTIYGGQFDDGTFFKVAP